MTGTMCPSHRLPNYIDRLSVLLCMSIAVLAGSAFGQSQQRWDIERDCGSKGTLTITKGEGEIGITLDETSDKLIDPKLLTIRIDVFPLLSIRLNQEGGVEGIRCTISGKLYGHSQNPTKYVESDHGQRRMQISLLATLISLGQLAWKPSSSDGGCFQAEVPQCKATIVVTESSQWPGAEIEIPLACEDLPKTLLAVHETESGEIYRVDLQGDETGSWSWTIWLAGKPGASYASMIATSQEQFGFFRDMLTRQDGWIRMLDSSKRDVGVPQFDRLQAALDTAASVEQPALLKPEEENSHRDRDWFWDVLLPNRSNPVGTVTWKCGKGEDTDKWRTSNYVFEPAGTVGSSLNTVVEQDGMPTRVELSRNAHLLVEKMICHYNASSAMIDTDDEEALCERLGLLISWLIGTGTLDVSGPKVNRGGAAGFTWPVGYQPFPFSEDSSISIVAGDKTIMDSQLLADLFEEVPKKMRWKRCLVDGSSLPVTYVGRFGENQEPGFNEWPFSLLRSCLTYMDDASQRLFKTPPEFIVQRQDVPKEDGSNKEQRIYSFVRRFPPADYWPRWVHTQWNILLEQDKAKQELVPKQKQESKVESKPAKWESVLSEEEKIVVISPTL